MTAKGFGVSGVCVVSKSSVNGRVIKAILESKLPFYSVKKIISLINGEGKEVAVNVAIQTLTKRGILKKEERGIYTLDNNPVVKLEETEQEYRITNPSLAEESEKNRRKKKVMKAVDDLEKYFNEEGVECVSDYFETIRREVNKKFGIVPEGTSSEGTSNEGTFNEKDPSENQLPEPPAEIPIVGFNEETTTTEEAASDNEEEDVSEPSNDEKDDTENRQAEIHFPE